MTIAKLLKHATKQFALSHIETPFLDGEILLACILKTSKEYLHTHPEQIVGQRQLKKFESLIKKRIAGLPVSYLVGYKWFYGQKFYVNQRVLIPRPETEHLVEAALEIIKKKNIKNIIDVGTGSGNIIISLAKSQPNKNYFATDRYISTLRIARKNARKLLSQNNIRFIRANLLTNISGKFDLIVSNLPYVPKSIPVETGEPKKAIYGGPAGTELYEKFFAQIEKYLNPKAQILVEIDSPAQAEMKKIIKRYLPNSRIKIKQDYAHKNRLIEIWYQA